MFSFFSGFSCFDVGTTGPLKSTVFTFYHLLLWASRGLFSKTVSPEYIQDTFRYEGVQIEAQAVFCRPVLGFKPLIFVFLCLLLPYRFGYNLWTPFEGQRHENLGIVEFFTKESEPPPHPLYIYYISAYRKSYFWTQLQRHCC